MKLKLLVSLLFVLCLNVSHVLGHGAVLIFFEDADAIIFVGIGSPSPNLLDGVSAKTDEGLAATVAVFSVNNNEDNLSIDTSIPSVNTVVYRGESTAGNEAFASQQYIVRDLTPPVITVIQSTISIPLGSDEPTYKDNATASDDQDGDISDDIVTTLGDGSQMFDSSSPITYTVTYSVSDSSGNAATPKTAQYIVFDNIPPVFNIMTNQFQLDLGANPPDLLTGVEANDNIDNDVSGDINFTILKNGTTIVAQIDTSALATYAVTYHVEDAAMNVAEVIHTYTIVDQVIPVIELDPVELTVDVGDSSIDLLIGATVTDNWDTISSSAIDTEPDVLDTSALADIIVSYNVKDGSDNSALEKSRTYHVVDRIKPVITIGSPVVDSNINDPLPVAVRDQISVSDNFYTIPVSSIENSGATPDNTAAGIYTVFYNVADDSGNVADTKTRVYRVGKIANPMDDDDADGMEDSWETAMLGDIRWNGNEDADRDGISNFVEFTFNTDPFEYEIQLIEGWNLISLSRVPSVNNIASIFVGDANERVLEHCVWQWDAIKQSFFVAEAIDAFSGFWMNAKNSVVISVDTELGAAGSVTSSGSFPDTDSDGLDDNWENLHFNNNLRWHGSDDADFDGMSNKEEFDAGTDPNGYEIEIKKGWNLMSLPSEPADNTIASIFSDQANEPVYKGLLWEWNATQQEYSSINAITPTKGFWIFSIKTTSISIETD